MRVSMDAHHLSAARLESLCRNGIQGVCRLLLERMEEGLQEALLEGESALKPIVSASGSVLVLWARCYPRGEHGAEIIGSNLDIFLDNGQGHLWGREKRSGWLWLRMQAKRLQLVGVYLHEAANLGWSSPPQPFIPGQGESQVRFGQHDALGGGEVGGSSHVGPIETFSKGV
jgi:hypothetical protein